MITRIKWWWCLAGLFNPKIMHYCDLQVVRLQKCLERNERKQQKGEP